MTITFDNLTLTQGDFTLCADMKIEEGHKIALLGPSGGGKSTLLSALAGFKAPESGRILWNDTDITNTPPAKRPITLLFQDHNLFPHLTVADQANVQAELVKSFGITQLHAAIGPSVGGLITLTFATRFPEMVRIVIPVASGFKTTVLNRLILFEQILAIENDPHFHGGDYYSGQFPDYGLALARMISHKTFVHLDTFEERARTDIKQDKETLKWYEVKDPFQSYMLYQGKKFVKRFDANTYLRIIDMWSRYNAVKEADGKNAVQIFESGKQHQHKYLIFSIDSDFCFYPEEQAILVKNLEKADVDHIHITVHSNKGHDSFLLEPDLYSPHISYVLGG